MVAITRVLRNAAQSASSAGAAANAAAKPMSAESTLYHVAPTGFWKTFRDAVVVNPEISSGLPIPELNRYPQPGSRTEKYATPATKASDPAFNPYWKRDTRRAFPQTSTITQTTLTSLLLASPALASLPSPTTTTKTPQNSSAITPSEPGSADYAVATSSVPPLSTALESLPAGKAFLGGGIKTTEGSGLPPVPPKVGAKWIPQPGDEIPSDKDAYFPMIGYR